MKVRDESESDFWITRERLNQLNAVKVLQVPRSITKRNLYLSPKMESVLSLMKDKQFRTLENISSQTGYESLTGLSAGIRSLRKFGHTIEKRKLDNQPEYEYRLV